MQRHHGFTATHLTLGIALIALVALSACGGAATPAATTAPTVAATTAAAATTRAAAANVTVKGSISKLADAGKSVTVKAADGKETLYEISSSRTILKDERPGGTVKTREDLKVGMLVTVVGPPNGGEATAFTVTG